MEKVEREGGGESRWLTIALKRLTLRLEREGGGESRWFTIGAWFRLGRFRLVYNRSVV
jgi:hypothetical protein